MGVGGWLGVLATVIGLAWLIARVRMRTESATVVSVPRGQYVQVRVELEDGERVTVSMEKEYRFKPGDVVKVSVLRNTGETVVVLGGGLRRLFGPTMTLLVGTLLLLFNLDVRFAETLWAFLIVGFAALLVLWFVFVVLLNSVVWIPLFRAMFGHTIEVTVDRQAGKPKKRFSYWTFTTVHGNKVQVEHKGEIPVGTVLEVRYVDLGPIWNELLFIEPDEGWRITRMSSGDART